MAANLRPAIGRAARSLLSEELLTLFRGPRPNPAAAAPPVAAQGTTAELMTKFDVSAKKDSTSRYAKTRSTHIRKNPFGSPIGWFGIFLTLAFLEAREMDKEMTRNT